MRSGITNILRVWLRYWAVFRKNLAYGLVTTFVEPILYLVSFGFGLGGLVGDISVSGTTVSYRAFVLAGIVGQTVLFSGFFEASYGGFVRMYYQRIFQAIAVTPVTLSEVLWGELVWDASRATLSATAVLFVGAAIGDFRVAAVLPLIPFCFLAGLVFSGLGLMTAAKSRTIDQISYPQYLFIFPMFLFCGVFFPLGNLPTAFQYLAAVLPLTPVLSATRALALGFPLEPSGLVVLGAWAVVTLVFSRRWMSKRLVH